MSTLSPRKIDKMRHALGLNRQKEAYRNYYSSEIDPDWESLVESGLAAKRKSAVSQGMLYHVTRSGALAVLKDDEWIGEDLTFPAGDLP